jgi:hypothetical protein
MLDLAHVIADPAAQPRVAILTDVVEDYAAAMAEGAEFPPIVVFGQGDGPYWLADGFHRYHAYRALGVVEVPAIIKEGGLREAILYSVGANAAHGLRRTNDDKRRAVMRLLNDPEWAVWSDREIARRCGVDNSFVSRIRPKPQALSVDEQQIEQPRLASRGGTTYALNTAAIGRRDDADQLAEPRPLSGTAWLNSKAAAEEKAFVDRRAFRELRKLWNAASRDVQEQFRAYIAKD